MTYHRGLVGLGENGSLAAQQVCGECGECVVKTVLSEHCAPAARRREVENQFVVMCRVHFSEFCFAPSAAWVA